jgi:small GTP-binding protein
MLTISKKVCLLGDFAVGKTSLVRRFVFNIFDDRYLSTIGVKVSRKTVALMVGDQPADLTIMLWDLAGSEEFDRIRASYLRGAAGAVLVCDVTRPATLERLADCAADLWRVSPSAHCVLAANKVDLTGEQRLTAPQIGPVASRLAAPWYLTSARTGDEVELLFRDLGLMMVG